MTDFHTRWADQCDAAEGIEERYGAEKALGYLVGEKLIGHLREATWNADIEAETPLFVARIKELFEPHILAEYLDDPGRLGSLGHVMGDAQFENFRAAGGVLESPVSGAEDALLLEQAKELLLDR